MSAMGERAERIPSSWGGGFIVDCPYGGRHVVNRRGELKRPCRTCEAAAQPITNPCLACDDPDLPCGTCLPRLRWEGTQEEDDEPECLVCLDVAWLLKTGTPGEFIASRLGRNPEGLARHLRNHEQPVPEGMASKIHKREKHPV